MSCGGGESPKGRGLRGQRENRNKERGLVRGRTKKRRKGGVGTTRWSERLLRTNRGGEVKKLRGSGTGQESLRTRAAAGVRIHDKSYIAGGEKKVDKILRQQKNEHWDGYRT